MAVSIPFIKSNSSTTDTYGRVTLVNGRATINNVYSDVICKIFLTYATIPTNSGRLAAPQNVVVGTSFDIVSTNNNDNADVYWVMILLPDIIVADTYAYPQLDRNLNYGYATLNANFITVSTPYARSDSIILVSTSVQSGAQTSDNYFIAQIVNGSSFTIGSTNPFDADNSTLAYLVISPSTTSYYPNAGVTYPILFTGGSENNFNIDQLVNGVVGIQTTSLVANCLVLWTTHTFASTPANTGQCIVSGNLGPPASISFTSNIGTSDNQRINWWILSPTDGRP